MGSFFNSTLEIIDSCHVYLGVLATTANIAVFVSIYQIRVISLLDILYQKFFCQQLFCEAQVRRNVISTHTLVF